MLPPSLSKPLKKLPQRDETWFGDRRPTGARVQDEGPLDGIVWLDGATEMVRAGTIVRREDSGPEALLGQLLEAMKRPVPGCEPARPRVVAVRDPAVRDYLSEALQPLRIEVRLFTECPPLETVFAGIERRVTGPDLSYLHRDDVPPELVGELFEAAADWVELEPWDDIFDSQLFRLEGLEPIPLLVSILGHAAKEFGFALYLNEQAARILLAGGGRKAVARQPVLSLTYLTDEQVGDRFTDDIERHGWRVEGTEWLPLLARFDRDEDEVLATADEIRLALAVMEALTRYLYHDGSRSSGKRTIRLASGREVKVDWPVRIAGGGSAPDREWEAPAAEEILEELEELGIEPEREWFEQRPPSCLSALDLARGHLAPEELTAEAIDGLRALWELWVPQDPCVETRYDGLREAFVGVERERALQFLDGMQALVAWAGGRGGEAQMAAALAGLEPEGILRAFVILGTDAAAEERARRWGVHAKLWPVLGALEGMLRRREGRTAESARIFDRMSRLKDLGCALPLLCGRELLRGAEARDEKLLRQAEWYLERAEQRVDAGDREMIRMTSEALAELYERTGKITRARQCRERAEAHGD